MAEKKEINAFARRYLALYTDHNTQERHLTDGFAEASNELGFLMDGGRSFVELYSEDAYDSVRGLLGSIDAIDDPIVLGSAIYSRWRYVTNWSNESLLDDENRTWFITALGRLAELTLSEHASATTLTGNLEKVQIISNNCSTGKRPTLGPQVEQCLTVHADGKVELSIAHFNADPGGHKVIESFPPTHIPRESAAKILETVGTYFRYAYGGAEQDKAAEAPPGLWKTILTNGNGRSFSISGSLDSRFELNGMDVSDLIRRLVGRSDLLVFDGNPDFVNRIEVRYRRGVHKDSEITWLFREQIIFDRRTESVEHLLEESPGRRMRSSYYVQGGVSSFLDTFDELSFYGIEGNPPDIIENKSEINAYEIAVYTRHGNNRLIRGTYDRRSLPRDWADFIDKALSFLGFYGYGELFDAERFGKATRRLSDYIYARVVFEGREGEFVYLTDDASLKMEDLVMVPVGNKNTPTPAQITEILYGSAEEAPYSFGKLKRILRRCTEEDIRMLNGQKKTQSHT